MKFDLSKKKKQEKLQRTEKIPKDFVFWQHNLCSSERFGLIGPVRILRRDEETTYANNIHIKRFVA